MTAKPRSGQRYRASADVPVVGITHWKAAFTGGFEAILPAGTIVRVSSEPNLNSKAATCTVETPRSDEVLVPREDREHEKYAGFSLVISFEDLDARFEAL